MKLKALRPRLETIAFRRIPSQQVERLRGRAAVERRARWLYRHPLCCRCEQDNKVTAATVPDHITPIWAGGADNERNLQSLCDPHHDAKTQCEARMRAAGGWMATPCTCGQHQG